MLRFFNLHLSLLFIFSNLIYVLLLFIILMSVVYLGGEITESLLFWGSIFLCVFFFLFCLSIALCLMSNYEPSSLPFFLYIALICS